LDRIIYAGEFAGIVRRIPELSHRDSVKYDALGAVKLLSLDKENLSANQAIAYVHHRKTTEKTSIVQCGFFRATFNQESLETTSIKPVVDTSDEEELAFIHKIFKAFCLELG
jgi:hypothetical protein